MPPCALHNLIFYLFSEADTPNTLCIFLCWVPYWPHPAVQSILTFFLLFLCSQLKLQLLFLHVDRQLRQSHGDVLSGPCIWWRKYKSVTWEKLESLQKAKMSKIYPFYAVFFFFWMVVRHLHLIEIKTDDPIIQHLASLTEVHKGLLDY